MQRGVHDLLGLPELWCHLLDFPLLVRDDKLFGVFEAMFAGEERPVAKPPTLATMLPSVTGHLTRTRSSPRIGNAGRLLHAAPVGRKIVLRLGQFTVAR